MDKLDEIQTKINNLPETFDGSVTSESLKEIYTLFHEYLMILYVNNTSNANLLNRLLSIQVTGIAGYSNYADLPPSGELNKIYKVGKDTDPTKNGWYHWDGEYIKDYDLIENTINPLNDSNGVSGKAVYNHVLNVTKKDIFYLQDPSAVSDVNRAKFTPVKDVKFDFTGASAYENYEFAIYYLGKDDPTFGSILWISRREDSNSSWVNKVVTTGGTQFQNNQKWFEFSTEWDGVDITFLFDTTVMTDNYTVFSRFPFKNSTEFTNQAYLNHLAVIDKLDVEVHEKHLKENSYNSITSNNYAYEHGGTNFFKISYPSGRSKETDFEENILPPLNSGIHSNVTKVVMQPSENAIMIANLKEVLYERLADYETQDGAGIFPVYFESVYYNSSVDTSVSIRHRIRTKINDVWYTPSVVHTVEPGETKKITLEINPEEVTWHNFDSGLFDVYHQFICSAGSETNIYIGEANLYFNDPKKRDVAQSINGSIIKSQSVEIDKLTTSAKDELRNGLPPTQQGIVLAGSSITWGDGHLTSNFAGKVLDYTKKQLASFVSVDDIQGSFTNFTNTKLYGGTGKQMTGLNSTLSFDIFGDELSICQAIKRTTDYAKIEVKADGVLIGSFDNVNHTLGNSSKSFTGNGTAIKFELDHPYTYNHNVTVGGVSQTVQINTAIGGSIPSGVDVLVIRKLTDDGSTKHILWFKVAPSNGAAINVTYDYGQVVCHEQSTVGQTTTDSINESNYGEGTVAFDPAAPSTLTSGQEYRSVNHNAFFNHKFLSNKKRKITLELVGGTNPYFIFNFATNRLHNFMNAGIGGWALSLLLDENGVHDYNTFFQDFTPNILVLEFATNDDWAYSSRRLNRPVSDISTADIKQVPTLEVNSITYDGPNYTANYSTGLITSIDRYSLICSEIVGSSVEVGDFVRIGNYHGDNRQVVVREVTSVNLTTGEIKWEIPLNASKILNIDSIADLVGAEVSIRSLSAYKTLYQSLITKIHNMSGSTKILLTQPGLSNYFTRQLWGYHEVHRQLANENKNVDVIEITDELTSFQESNISGLSNESVNLDGSSSYNLSKSGHWQGFKVWVNGVDVYGKDCYIESGSKYKVNQLGGFGGLQVGAYYRSHLVNQSLKLVFFQNAPVSGTAVVEYADGVWSEDYAHVNTNGAYIYGQKYISAIANKIN